MNEKDFDLVVDANKIEKQYFKDLWNYRELFFIFAWRDVLVRYKQTIIGILWAIIRPLLTMIIFTFVFNKIAGLKSGNIPYPILVLSGLLPWQFFANAFAESSGSLLANANIISKVYFPRMVIPASSVIVSFVDFVISFSLLIILMISYNFYPDWKIIFLPFFIGIAFIAAYGSGLIISALNVKYRDFQYVVPFVVQLGLYLSPIGYNSTLIDENWRMLYSLNPMVGVIEGVRWCISGGQIDIHMKGFALSSLMVILLFLWGIIFFRRTEKSFADVI